MHALPAKIFLPFVALIFLGLSGLPTQPAQADDSEQSVTENQQLEQALITALTNKDLDGIMKLYWHSPNLAVTFPDGSTVKGWDNVRTAYQGYFSAIDTLTGSVFDSSYLSTGDTFLGTGTFTFDAKLKGGGQSVHEASEYVDVQEKKDGQWVIVIDRIQPTQAPAAKNP